MGKARSAAKELSSAPGFDAALLALGKSLSLSFPHLQSWGDGATLFHTVLGDSQVNSDIVAINESGNLLIPCCSSIIACGTLNMVLRWLYETYAVVILTPLSRTLTKKF